MIKTGVMQMYGIGVLLFFETLWKFLPFFANRFLKEGIHRRTSYIPVSLRNSLVSFCFSLSTAFEKVCAG